MDHIAEMVQILMKDMKLPLPFLGLNDDFVYDPKVKPPLLRFVLISIYRMTRADQFSILTEPNTEWDLIVIGGGATGLAIALDASSRGYKTALFEAADFAESTSSKSTKLIHGGVRYLRGGEISLVREALHERGYPPEKCA